MKKTIVLISIEPTIDMCLEGDVLLVNGSAPWEGLVEVCIDKKWIPVCGNYYWTQDTSGANTVCKQLGYSPNNATAYQTQNSRAGGVYLYNVHCDARANRLVDCVYNTLIGCYGYLAGVLCEGMIIVSV